MEKLKIKIYDKGGKSLTVVNHDGYILPWTLPAEDLGLHMQAIRSMQSRSDDVLIAAFPRSGTHWLLEAVNMLLTHSTEHLGRDLPNPTGKPDGQPIIEFMHMDKAKELKSPRLLNTHLRPNYTPKDFKGRIIHLTRNPKDVAVSFYTFFTKMKPLDYDGKWDDFIQLYVDGNVHFGPPFAYLKEWREFERDHPEQNFLHVTYEDLHQNFTSTLKRIATFLDIRADESFIKEIKKECSINKIRQSKRDATKDFFLKETEKGNEITTDFLYRKGVVGDWKHWFTAAQSEMFDAAFNKEMDY